MFKDFKDVAPDPLKLPINGRLYVIPPVSAADGLKAWQWIKNGAKADGTSAKVEDVARLLLGAAHKRLLADKVSWQALNRVYLTVISDFTNGRSAAEVMWETGGNPKALTAMTRSAKPEGDDTTPPPDSTNGTRTSPAKPTRES
jgi:hypothetical protein